MLDKKSMFMFYTQENSKEKVRNSSPLLNQGKGKKKMRRKVRKR